MAPTETDVTEKKQKSKKSLLRIRKPARSEISTQASEFNLVKASVSNKNLVTTEDLTKSLGPKAKLNSLKKKVKAVKTGTKILLKPLEKPAAERVKRKVGFENAKKGLNKWAGVVAHQRTAVTVKFPLKENSMQMEPSEIANRFVLKTDLEKKLEEIDPPKQPEPVIEEKCSLTLAEVLEQRSEAAKLRAQQSYSIAKARRTKKIKSKKYHRIARKAKVKQQIKDFEELKKKDPEAALEKLDLIDKARAHERMTLRHKSTGKWARNKQIRAKYDNESRQALAEQLAISRELTQKLKNDDSDDDEYVYENVQEDAPVKASETDNPWNPNTKPTESDIDAFIGQYRKFWDEKCKKKAEAAEENSEEQDSDDNEKESVDSDDIAKESMETNDVQKGRADTNDAEKEAVENSDYVECVADESSTKKGKKKKMKKQKEEIEAKKSQKKLVKAVEETTKLSKTNKKKSSVSKTDTAGNESVQNLKSKTEKITEKKVKNKKNKKKAENSEAKSKDNSVTDLEKLGLKNQRAVVPVIDTPMDESTGNDAGDEKSADQIKSVINQVTKKRKVEDTTLDQNKIIKPKIMKTMLPDDTDEEDVIDDVDEESEEVANMEDERRFSQAFNDTDLVRDFKKDKADEIKKNKPQDIDLSLPGWGSWGGPGIKQSRRKKRRFIIKAPKAAPRRDENKGNVIILEENAPKIRRHMVSDLPFPYTAVKDFEASMRAPIGREFVPEKTFTKLTLPHVKTKMGKIIEPMTEDALMKKVKCDLAARDRKPLAGAAKGEKNKAGKKK